MIMSKIKKLPVVFALVITLVSSLMMSTIAFADVVPGPNGEYCTIKEVNFKDNAWNSTASSPIIAGKATEGTDILGNTGGIPVLVQYSEGCEWVAFHVQEVDSNGNPVGNFYFYPKLVMTPTAANCSTNTQFALLPSSWFTDGKEYKIYSFGYFESRIGHSSPQSSVYVHL